jgi:hypothetical protein
MPMISPFFIRLGSLVALGLCLAGCSESYRYKLTLAVNTPQGIKRGSSVVEDVFWSVSIPERGITHRLGGEALYLDLGPGARPLIALLTSHIHQKYGVDRRWTRDAGPNDNLLVQLYGPPSADFMDNVARLARMRGPRRITPADLPDLVTFADVNDPASVVEVNPKDLQATLGQNVTWNEMTLEMTDEPITTGIKAKLPWLSVYFAKNLRLDGSGHGAKHELANVLDSYDFDQIY